jgi:DNA-binding response OmpR family regulator
MMIAGAFRVFGTESNPLDNLAGRPATPMRRVLVVEDEQNIRDLVSRQLQRAGYNCLSVADGKEGLTLALKEPFDVVVLDLMLPGVDGMTLCRAIRSHGINRESPILMLTARRTERDKVAGLESGADDYVTKPFGVLELIARVAALTRRGRRAAPVAPAALRGHVAARDVELDPLKHTVRVRRAPVSLTPHEFELLYQLASRPGVVLTRKELLAAVWREQAFVTERSIDTLVRHLRRKIEEDAALPRLILTVWGYGYKFADP